MQDRGQPADGFGIGFPVDVGGRPHPVGHAACAHRDAPLARALAVAIGIGEIAQNLVPLPADPVPQCGGQRFGHDLGGIQRQPLAFQPRQGGGKALGRPQDHRGGDTAPVRRDPARRDPGHACAFGDGNALAFHGSGQPAHQLGRLDPRHAGHHHAAQKTGDIDPRPRRLGPDGKDPVGAFAPVLAMGDFGCYPGHLRRGHRHHQLVRAADIGVDPFQTGDADYLVHGAVHRLHHGTHPLGRAGGQVFLMAPGKPPCQPAAVAARGPEACEFLFHDQDAQRRVRLLQIPGRPKPGIARPDDAHVDSCVAVQRRAPLRQATQIGIPERHVTNPGKLHLWSRVCGPGAGSSPLAP